MKPYNLEVGWSADDLAAAAAALKACKEINPENPGAAAKMIGEIWQLLNEAYMPILDEAERRQNARQQDKGGYWSEMDGLAARIDAVIRKATKKEGV